MKTLTLVALGAISGVAVAALGVDLAFAARFSDVAQNINSQMSSVAELITGGAYLGGAGVGVQAALKFKEHNENPQQNKLSKPITLAAVSGALLALPSFLSVGTDSMFNGQGGNGRTGAITNSNLRI